MSYVTYLKRYLTLFFREEFELNTDQKYYEDIWMRTLINTPYLSLYVLSIVLNSMLLLMSINKPHKHRWKRFFFHWNIFHSFVLIVWLQFIIEGENFERRLNMKRIAYWHNDIYSSLIYISALTNFTPIRNFSERKKKTGKEFLRVSLKWYFHTSIKQGGLLHIIWWIYVFIKFLVMKVGNVLKFPFNFFTLTNLVHFRQPFDWLIKLISVNTVDH